MDIKEIIRIVDLLQKVNCSRLALISEVARELGVKKTALMQFIEDNPKLFCTQEMTRRSKRGTSTVGLAIRDAYPTAGDNPATDEWLELRRKEWEKKLHVAGYDYYGRIEYHYFPEDNPKDSLRTGLWRNTPEKFRELEEAGVLKKRNIGSGGFGDYSVMERYVYNDDSAKALAEHGWTTDFNEKE